MGVHGLWRLLDSFGQVTTPEEWRGRRVAIDASIWMAQFRSMCAPGDDAEQKILEGFLVRILKLIFYGIKPLFVFDGIASASKTMEHRRRQKARETLAQAALKRRARQILVGQVASGMLHVNQLAAKPPSVPEVEPLTEGTVQSPDEGDDKQATDAGPHDENGASRRHTHRHTHKRRRHRHRHPIAPEAVSRAVTDAFLDDAEAVLQERGSGEQRVLQNALRFTSTSLFMGPRKVVETPDTIASASAALAPDEEVISDNSAVTVSTTSSLSGSPSSNDDDVKLISPGRERESSVVIVSQSPTPSTMPHPNPTWKLRGLSSPSRDRFPPPDEEAGGTDNNNSKMDEYEISSSDDENDEDEAGSASTSGSSLSDEESMSDSASSTSSRFDERDLWNPSTQLPTARVRTNEEASEDDDDDDADFTPVPLPHQPGSGLHKVAETTSTTDVSVQDSAAAAWWAPRGHGGADGASRSRVVPFELLDIVTLLEQFGVPFCLSPSEADAQCAYLCAVGVVDAVFTEDSDVVVHGGTVVLRGFFAHSKQVVEYRQSELAACGLDKRVLVALALLLGCDYTDGVTGIGLVGALQALTAAWTRDVTVEDSTHHSHVFHEGDAAKQPEFVCALLTRWRELVHHPSASWEEGDKNVSVLQHLLLSRYHHEWASLGIAEYEPAASAAALFYSPEVDKSDDTFETTPPNWPGLRAFAASRGLLGATWVVQRFELAQKEYEKQAALAQQHDAQQTRLTDFGVQNRVRERWAYKKLPPKFATILENLRQVRQKP